MFWKCIGLWLVLLSATAFGLESNQDICVKTFIVSETCVKTILKEIPNSNGLSNEPIEITELLERFGVKFYIRSIPEDRSAKLFPKESIVVVKTSLDEMQIAEDVILNQLSGRLISRITPRLLFGGYFERIGLIGFFAEPLPEFRFYVQHGIY